MRPALVIGLPVALLAILAGWMLFPARGPGPAAASAAAPGASATSSSTGTPAVSVMPAGALAAEPLTLPSTGEPATAQVPAKAASTVRIVAPAHAESKQALAPRTAVALAAKEAAPPVKPGRVTLAVSPWGEVVVDGRSRGVSPPLTELRLPPGKHTIELRNSTFAPHSETIDIAADASVKLKHKFE
jgi:hypothetical protein